MRLIKRFDLSVEPTQILTIPFNSEILGFGSFQDKPALWVLIENANKPQVRTFHFVGEDKELGVRLNRTNYIGRFEAKAEVGLRVVHLFEE